MRTLIPAFVTALLVAVPVATAQPDSGALIVTNSNQSSTSPMGTQNSTMLIEQRILGEKIRTDTYPGGVKGKSHFHGTTIHDFSTGTVTSIVHGNKTYRISSPEDLEEEKKAMRDRLGMLDIPKSRPELVATDEEQEVNGYWARKYVSEVPTGKLIYWIADEPELLKVQRRAAELASTPTTEMLNLKFPDPLDFPGFVVKSVFRIEMPEMDMTNVTSTDINIQTNVTFPQDLFEIPDGYTEQP